jgi:quinol monooxygenase YgiN
METVVLLITGTFRIPPEKLAEARETMHDMVLSSRKEAGCISYHMQRISWRLALFT